METRLSPGLPHQFEMHRSQYPSLFKNKEKLSMAKRVSEMDAKSHGEIVNSFLELEANYAVHWREVVCRKAWLVGPVGLCNEKLIEQSHRGGGNKSFRTEELLQWLDSKHAGSVVYICFGSMANLVISNDQLMKIAIALKESDRHFIWVIKSSDQEDYTDWLHHQRMGSSDTYIKPSSYRGCSHCGWNSTLEAISAGVPMITWPMNGDQFFNEKPIVEVLQVGVTVGAKEGGWYFEERQLIEAETIRSVIERVVDEGFEGEAMRNRAKELKEKAEAAMQEGGSSYADIRNLIGELMDRRNELLI
ncbi:hypothetical protein LUZ63_016862 [Rhynchospora breviuscula]|uniref:Uncharacterized protein n=1 Tax=Rhynchospora breviuscula TaxID=2022672 RepID=A0A9Q0C1F0_9POAL|nr:hypothetical protein LUZ63_016862 [Rhynchospora breviuscula]